MQGLNWIFSYFKGKGSPLSETPRVEVVQQRKEKNDSKRGATIIDYRGIVD